MRHPFLLGGRQRLRLGVMLLMALALVRSAIAQQLVAPQPPRAAEEGVDGPLPPDKAAQSFRLAPGLRIEAVAAEPLIVSPVALAFDERGRLYVAENRGYPTGPGPGQPGVGRIARLEDTDGDGRMDRRTEFAQGLAYPNGVMPWKGGVIVTDAPDVLFLRDTDGDGVADERRVLFTGFATQGSTQLRVSHPTLSVDNWVYLTSGLTGGRVVSPAAADRRPVDLKREDFRFRPDGDVWEAADGGAQFGLTFDDFGRRFICYNRVQVQHVVIASKVLRRNPHLAFSDTVQNCPAETVPEPLQGHGSAARLYPISRNITTADSHAGTFTAACGVTIWRGSGLPAQYQGGAFSCDPTGNLVHFDRLEPKGATYSARAMLERTEFLASRDNWFRPVFLAHGPDGGLYVCDMYRKTIEHPDYLPVEIRKRTDFESGKTMGRIWWVMRDDPGVAEPRRANAELAGASNDQLCAALRDADGWRRDTAHRLLLERRERAAAAPLRVLAADSQAPPAAVVHAIHLLEALGTLDDDLLRSLLKHTAPPVRENALQLVEPRLAQQASWLDEVLPCAQDPDARVRFQTAVALGARPASAALAGEDDRIAEALARIAARDGADRWARAAAFSALAGRERKFLTALKDVPRRAGPLFPELLRELGRLLGSSPPAGSIAELLQSVLAPRAFTADEEAALVTGLAEAARSRGTGARDGGDVLSALADRSPAGDRLNDSIRNLVAAMRGIALDPARPVGQRRVAIELLAFTSFDQAGAAFVNLLESEQPSALRSAAVRALGTQGDVRGATALLDAGRFASYTPALRDEVLAAIVAQARLRPLLLSAIERGSIAAGMIDAARRRQLLQDQDADLRRRAVAVFGAVQADRAAVYEAFKGVLDLPADPARGHAVFRRECASCHRLDREGFAVGPDLFGIRNQPKSAILLHVLAPDLEITQGFAAYTVATRDGRVLTGLIASETPTSLTLRQQLGKEDTILRQEIEEIKSSKQSLMPTGLEKTISRQDFADLLAYLKGEEAPSRARGQ